MIRIRRAWAARAAGPARRGVVFLGLELQDAADGHGDGAEEREEEAELPIEVDVTSTLGAVDADDAGVRITRTAATPPAIRYTWLHATGQVGQLRVGENA